MTARKSLKNYPWDKSDWITLPKVVDANSMALTILALLEAKRRDT